MFRIVVRSRLRSLFFLVPHQVSPDRLVIHRLRFVFPSRFCEPKAIVDSFVKVSVPVLFGAKNVINRCLGNVCLGWGVVGR